MIQPFVAPKMKAQRAAVHMERLEVLLDEFAARQGDFSDGVTTTIGYIGRFAPEVPLVLGDAVHNLRAALDLLACDLVRLNGNSAKDVHFPFSEAEGELELMIRKRKFDRAATEAVTLLRALQPYKGGNILLRALHELDIMDKHQLIIPVNAQTEIRNMRIGTPGGGGIHMRGVVMRNVMQIGSFGGGPVRVEGEAKTRVLFDQDAPSPLPGRVVIETLKEMAQTVAKVIEDFEALGLRPPEATPSGD
jgi:hypothetical protein